MAVNDGKDYERFVGQLQQALLDAEKVTTQRTITVERNKMLEDRNGTSREFDLYWEYELGGLMYRTVIECKDYASPISVEKIDALIGKIQDCPGISGVFATKTGYQSGAKTKAESHGIELLVVREQRDDDWVDEEGTPYLREIHLTMSVGIPPRITDFTPYVDATWAEENTDYREGDSTQISGMNNEIFIVDETAGTKVSLYDIQATLKGTEEKEFGEFDQAVECENSFLEAGDQRFKLKGYRLKYLISPRHDELSVIDFSEELVGVIEYLQRGVKRSIFRRGVIREEAIRNAR